MHPLHRRFVLFVATPTPGMRRATWPSTLTQNQIVPACKPYTISWTPTTPNSVSLVLLRGPAENIKPLTTIVTGISNNGAYVWTPSSGLEADVTHYGLQIIDDVTGQYQYSNQFGISKGAECNGVTPSSAVSTPYGGGYPVSTPVPSSKASSAASSAGYPVQVSSTKPNVSSTIVTKPTPVPSGYSTGVPHGNSTVVMPTKSMSVPGSLLPSGSGSPTKSSSLPESTGAASSLQAAFGLAGAVAAFAFML
jgi:hypothetical protein